MKKQHSDRVGNILRVGYGGLNRHGSIRVPLPPARKKWEKQYAYHSNLQHGERQLCAIRSAAPTDNRFGLRKKSALAPIATSPTLSRALGIQTAPPELSPPAD